MQGEGNLDASFAKEKEMLELECSRSAVKNGLRLERRLGVNPDKPGLAAGRKR